MSFSERKVRRTVSAILLLASRGIPCVALEAALPK